MQGLGFRVGFRVGFGVGCRVGFWVGFWVGFGVIVYMHACLHMYISYIHIEHVLKEKNTFYRIHTPARTGPHTLI